MLLRCPECGNEVDAKQVDMKTIMMMHRMQRMSGFQSIKGNLDSEDRVYFCPICGSDNKANEFEEVNE